MKKLLGIVALGLLLSSNAYSNNKLNSFNKWLYDNGHHDLQQKLRVQFVRLKKNTAQFGIHKDVINLNIRIILK